MKMQSNKENTEWIRKARSFNCIENSLPVGLEKWIYRFKGRFTKDNKGCYIFSGNRDCDGYPTMSYKNKRTRANRLSWILAKGDIPAGYCVCHKCDTPSCINPDHLFLGTNHENTADRNSKNRQAKGKRQHVCKLSEEQVKRMRLEHFQEKQSIRTLAAKYGVCFATAREAINGINWGWIKE
jgi:hypothetical protein